MRNKNALWMSLVIPLLFSMAIARVNAEVTTISVEPVSAEHPAQDIWVEPDFVDGLQKSDEFTVSVMIKVTAPTPGGGTGLYGWEYYLIWDPVELSLTGTAEPDLVADFGWTNGYWVKKNVQPAPDYFANESVWCSATTLQLPTFTGVVWLSNYTFHVEKSVFEPDPAETGYIFMDLIGLLDDTVGNIVPFFTDKEVVEFRIGTTSTPSAPLPVGNIAIVIVIAIFFVAALYYAKKRVFK